MRRLAVVILALVVPIGPFGGWGAALAQGGPAEAPPASPSAQPAAPPVVPPATPPVAPPVGPPVGPPTNPATAPPTTPATAPATAPPATPPATPPVTPPVTPPPPPGGEELDTSPPLIRILTPEDQWTIPGDVDPASPEGQLIEARKALVEGQPRRAEALASAWLDRHDPHPLRPEAFLIRGDALVAMNDEYKALYDYEAICTLYPGSEPYVSALRRELDIAKAYAGGMKRKLWGIRIVSAVDEAVELMIRIQERLPGSTLAEEAGMALADYYFTAGEMTLAAEAYQLFMENYPRSAQFRKARLRFIYARLASFKGPAYDASGLLEAAAQLRTLQEIEPLTAEQIGADAILLRIDESLASKLVSQARWYARTGDPISAELSVRRAIERYPRSIAALEAAAFGVRLVPRLPAWLQAQVPDYAALVDGSLPLDSVGAARRRDGDVAPGSEAGPPPRGPADIRGRLKSAAEAPAARPDPTDTPARPRDPVSGEPRQ